MRPFTARRLALAALVPALFVLSVIPGCSNESEGERCGDSFSATNNDDCGSGLVCTPSALLVNGQADDPTNRCCYTDRVTDSRCTRNSGVNAVEPNGDAGSSPTEAGTSVPAGGGGGGGETQMPTAAGAGGA
ncbi:MAG TPA: hypothetical protein VHW01_02680 [Polyangiaceae bacterium]|jgi:hypothetical protein|nr:hypothetical protein [Polyangiaceae bacterium]